MIFTNILKKGFGFLGYEIDIVAKSQAGNSEDFSRLKKSFSKHDVLKLHFGCGPRVLKGWINIDLMFEPYEKYLKYYTDEFYPESIRGSKEDFFSIDITKTGLPLSDNSVDVVFHEDFLEHLTQKEQIIFLAETFRVLKKGGIHRVNTPRLDTSMRKNSNFSKGFAGVYKDEWNNHRHLDVLTPKILEEYAVMVGYSKVVFNSKNGSTSPLLPKEYRPSGDRSQENGNIFADLVK